MVCLTQVFVKALWQGRCGTLLRVGKWDGGGGAGGNGERRGVGRGIGARGPVL